MAQFIVELSGLPTDALVAYLAASPAPFGPSALYTVATEERIVDPEQRLSTFRALTDPAAFALAEALVAGISLPHAALSLVRNDVTHIKYATGGFFRPHQDYLSLVSNVVQEYTLLICVTPPALAALTEGGETRVEGGKGHALLSRATTLPGAALLFRKDLVHEGMPLLKGTKEIVSLNIWATRKDAAGDPLLLVTFPQAPRHAAAAASAAAGGGGSAAAAAAAAAAAPSPPLACSRCHKPALQLTRCTCALAQYCSQVCQTAHWKAHKAGHWEALAAPLRALAQERSFVLAASTIRAMPSCILNGKLHYEVEGGGSASSSSASSSSASSSSSSSSATTTTAAPAPAIITFHCTDYSYQEFETVFRALSGMYVRPVDVVQHARALDYFGISPMHVLSASVNAGNAKVPEAKGELAGFVDGGGMPVGGGGGGGGEGEEGGAGGGSSAKRSRSEVRSASPAPAPSAAAAAASAAEAAAAASAAAAPPLPFHPVTLGAPLPMPAPRVDPLPLADPDAILICTTAERAAVVAEAAKALHLPYVRFHAVFAEGRVAYGGEMTGEPSATLVMQPVWVTVGDYDNLLCWRTIIHKGTQEWKPLHEAAVAFKRMPAPGAFFPDQPASDSQEETFVVEKNMSMAGSSHHYVGDAVWLGLLARPLVGPGDTDSAFSMHDVLDFLMPGDSGNPTPHLQFFPSAAGPPQATPSPLFHLDAAGKACFSAAEAAAASAHLIAMQFLAHVQERITRTQFHVAQTARDGEAQFCNESVYGRMNILEVSGVVRLAQLQVALPPPLPREGGDGGHDSRDNQWAPVGASEDF